MDSKNLVNAVIWVGVVVLGVIAGGYLMNWGRKNDVDVLKDAHAGYDS